MSRERLDSSRSEKSSGYADVFISYASEDRETADAVCAKLESGLIQCWIAPRDVSPGEKYVSALVHAIDNSRIFVLIFSHFADNSPHVRTELERAFNHEKMIILFRIEDIEPSEEFQYFVGSRQWLDALTLPIEPDFGQPCCSNKTDYHKKERVILFRQVSSSCRTR